MAIETELRDLIASNYPPEDARRVAIFAERLFEREDSREPVPADRRLGMVQSAAEFFAVRDAPIVARVEPVAGDESLTAVETVTADCPFIVDSLLEYFHHLGATVRTMLHPVIRVARDGGGRIISMEQSSAAERGESFVHAELELPWSADLARKIRDEVIAILTEVHDATDDFHRMTGRALQICDETAPNRELIEVREFLRWLVQGGFVFLGYRRLNLGDGAGKFTVDAGTELGIMREHDESRFRSSGSLEDLTAARRKLFFEGPPLAIGKTRAESIVHRRRPMDSVSIRRSGSDGRAIAFDNFVGLFTSKAYSEEAQHIPVLRAKLREVLAAERAESGSHDYKEIVSAFNSFPKDELFRAPAPELVRQLRLILDVKRESEVRLILTPDVHHGHVIALVVMPRDAFSAEVRQRIQSAIAERLQGTLVYYYLALGEGYTARLHFCFATDQPKASVIRELEAEIIRLARRWPDRLREKLIEQFGAKRGAELAARWKDAFSADYVATCDIDRAARDIDDVERLLAGGHDFMVETGRGESKAASDSGATADLSEIRIIGLGEAPVLSDLMPTLQNFGIRVLTEDAYELKPGIAGKSAHAYLQAFSVRGPGSKPFADFAGAKLIPDALAAARSGLAADDALNALTLSADLSWREVSLLRTYLVAVFQMRLAPARLALQRVLLLNPELSRALVELFSARLSPDLEASVEQIAALRAAYTARLAAIEHIADDRIARVLLSMVEATVRTNFFREMPAPDPYIALKFESARITGLPDTAPLYEIHVNSPRMEGCHLRAGKIARGGIRFSDRPDDYRTEILDLMKTQTVKNAIIVPIGSKGGFIVKPRTGHPADPKDGVEAYQTLINAMLDLTDNLTDAGVVHPPRVKVLDTDGPYLVVAADKGTASFSDIANGIALERGFWLGDAFASGGEHGYDHKKMGITARGAWESARRHLREMGRDIEKGQPVTIAGIGDMSGDVFGNGLLRSRNVKLIAAFDHRHIFIDPEPNPESSFDERRRLYDLPRSQWSDYNPALISAGGGVFRRGQKRIELSPQARAALGCDFEGLDGESIVQAILRAPVDLLYNGGIGTYVRATTESDADVGDHANDASRIAATELRAKVVVEGGNLGFTQKARIEYALNGGRINTDAIDNSGGVDMSDHEVNLKILLEPAVARGALTFDARNQALARCADDVAERVIADNRDQVLSLSLEQVRSRAQMIAFRDHLQAIEDRGIIRRTEAVLPTREALHERRARYAGLTRPELAVTTAYTKIDLVARIATSAFVDDPYLVERFLKPYFPASLAVDFGEEMTHHRLRRELIATRAINELVDLEGSTFVFSFVRDYGVSAEDAVRAWVIASDILSIHPSAEELKRNPSLTASADNDLGAYLALERASRSATGWALTQAEPARSIGAVVSHFKPAFESLSGQFETMLAAAERERFERIYRELRNDVADGELAHGLARLAFADHILAVLSLSCARAIEIPAAARAYFGLSAEINFALLEEALLSIGIEDRWERRAGQELAAELRAARVALCCAVLDAGKAGVAEGIAQLKLARSNRFAEVARLFDELKLMPSPGLPAIHVLIRALSRLAAAAQPQAP
ncbi:MAG: NAD-glutamate dehydrogenase [Candidatus Binatus sp.]|uniref:NAD-glutamate dehydrogenase domain-containing protein n=1 Tax=Candidatus Binatus sp. TaxID=2811406 RepID=UPI002718423E|nr:NAD-glutamate dehydrogenase domain-containing protein [Candidatus Binatus sp.]MDO8432302.1 NAD-glutamate dehydrogenase [Candidatus Binatus sp.]